MCKCCLQTFVKGLKTFQNYTWKIFNWNRKFWTDYMPHILFGCCSSCLSSIVRIKARLWLINLELPFGDIHQISMLLNQKFYGILRPTFKLGIKWGLSCDIMKAIWYCAGHIWGQCCGILRFICVCMLHKISRFETYGPYVAEVWPLNPSLKFNATFALINRSNKC